MTRPRFSIRHIMVAIAVIGVLLGAMVWARGLEDGGLRLRDDLLNFAVLFLLPVAFITAVFFMVRAVSRQPLRIRLVTEVATLLLLLVFSSVIWRPNFYTQEERRCQSLARLASEATSDSPEGRAALDRESAWFSRRASALRWRGLWIGLTRGPSTRDDPTPSEFVYQMGVLETNEKHEKIVERYSSMKRPF